jgi:hypothetical protein
MIRYRGSYKQYSLVILCMTRSIPYMLVLPCFFCNTFQTQYDMRVHLRNTHQKELVTHFPLRGKGFNMDYRTGFVINIMKRMRPPEFYDHRSTKFASLDKSDRKFDLVIYKWRQKKDQRYSL